MNKLFILMGLFLAIESTGNPAHKKPEETQTTEVTNSNPTDEEKNEFNKTFNNPNLRYEITMVNRVENKSYGAVQYSRSTSFDIEEQKSLRLFIDKKEFTEKKEGLDLVLTHTKSGKFIRLYGYYSPELDPKPEILEHNSYKASDYNREAPREKGIFNSNTSGNVDFSASK